MRSFLISFAFAFLLWGTPSLSEGFADSTDGQLEESEGGFTKEEFEAMKNSTDPHVRKLYERLVNGRKSSSQDEGSRFSGHLEMHDFDLDGISDHGHSGNDAEGGVEDAILGKRKTSGQSRLDKLREARLKQKNCLQNITGSKPSECKNISAAVLDVGAAHEGEAANSKDLHRVYILNPEVVKNMKKAGDNYFAKFKTEVLDGEGALSNSRAYGNDEIRSEAAWLYKQWQFKLETSWLTLRAARLAGYHTDQPDSPGYDQAMAFMQRVGQSLGKSKDPRAIAEQIYYEGATLNYSFCRTRVPPSRWQPGSCKKTPTVAGLQQSSIVQPATNKGAANGQDTEENKSLESIFRENPNMPEQEKQSLYMTALNELKRSGAKNNDVQKEIAKIAKCMDPSVWCYNANTPKDDKKKIEPFVPVRGDPGAVFTDTREGLYLKMSESTKRPLAEMRRYVADSIDFSPRMSGGRSNPVYKEWDEYVSGLEKQVKEIREYSAERRKISGKGPGAVERVFDPQRNTVLQMFGNNEINNTFSSEYMQSGPAPAASGGRPPAKLPGTDVLK